MKLEYRSHSSQSGAALLVALVMLLISTMIGLASIRGTTLQERMSANMYDRSLAHQAAEAALRAAEEAIAADSDIGIDCIVVTEDCPSIPATTFTNTTTNWSNVGSGFMVNDDKLGSTPQFYIEQVGTVGGTDELGVGSSANCDNYAGCDQTPPTAMLYRVTARSGVPSDDGRSVVALQITVKQNL